MSFFHEPPPLDSDVPPPLDDKLRNDFELEEDDEIVEDSQFDLPELPTDFNVFSSAATDDNFTNLPPAFQTFAMPSASPPPDIEQRVDENCINESSETCDVAKEKESLEAGEAVSQHQPPSEGRDNRPDGDSRCLEVGKSEHVAVSDETTLNSTTVCDDAQDIPADSVKTLGNVKEDAASYTLEDDDEFNEFAGTKIESPDASKSEELLGKQPEFDMFTGFEAEVQQIPEPIPELNLDEDDDDFNDFETAIPVNREVEISSAPRIEEQAEPAEFNFVADFSAFNAFEEPAEIKTFEEFKATGFDSTKDEEDDDDDFGDFNDFTEPTVAVSEPTNVELQPIALAKTTNVNGIIDMMFPPITTPCVTENDGQAHSSNATDQHIIKSDNFVNKFNDFDSTLALGYLYTSSKASRSLVKALGIDTRNILQGPQWMSSSSNSNMPRYAANLSFSPIEPLKPSSSHDANIKQSTEVQPAILQPTKALTEIVPEAEFDWNSSGLVNPLDGSQPKPQQPHDGGSVIIIPQPAPTHFIENEPSFNVVDQEVTQVFEAEAKANAGNKPELGESSAYQWSSEAGFTGHLASSNVGVRERTIKLPETHIFTPVKGTSPVAREVTSRDESPTPVDDAYFPKGPITVKEYHDVEYSLEPKKRLESDGDFDDFQSAQPAVNSNPPLVPLSVLEPKPIEKLSTEIKWPEPGNVAQSVTNDLDFLEAPAPTLSMESAPTQPAESLKLNFNLPIAPTPTVANTSKRKEQAFARPVIGTSPTEQNGSTEDDDFNDFQAAPLPKPPIKPAPSNDPITLSPARLVATANKHSNQKSSWISSIDNDEISRIEAAFPKCKTDKKSPQKSNDDDDDWSDFVGASQPPGAHHPFPQPQPPSTISSNAMSSSRSFTNGDADDWSDFVSVPSQAPKMPSSKSSGAISSQFQSKPNFSSWNQPIAKPYVNHTTSFLTNNSGNNSHQFTSSNYPYVTDKIPRQSMTITNNFNYNFNQTELYQGMAAPGGSHQQTKPNGISTILPELDFAMPKHLINLPRGGQLDPGKK